MKILIKRNIKPLCIMLCIMLIFLIGFLYSAPYIYIAIVGNGLNVAAVINDNEYLMDNYKYENMGESVVGKYIEGDWVKVVNHSGLKFYVSHISTDYYINNLWKNQTSFRYIHPIEEPGISPIRISAYGEHDIFYVRCLTDLDENDLTKYKHRISIYYYIFPYGDHYVNKFTECMLHMLFPGAMKIYVKHFYDVPFPSPQREGHPSASREKSGN